MIKDGKLAQNWNNKYDQVCSPFGTTILSYSRIILLGLFGEEFVGNNRLWSSMMASVYQLIVSFFCFAGIHPRWCRMFGILVRHDSYAGYAFSRFRMTCLALVARHVKTEVRRKIAAGEFDSFRPLFWGLIVGQNPPASECNDWNLSQSKGVEGFRMVHGGSAIQCAATYG